jgi:flavodoxin
MKPCVLYFSRTGNTKRVAEAIANQVKAPLFDIATCEPSVVTDYDTLFLGTPVEGASPTKEIVAFIDRLPTSEGKKTILFCTYRLFGNARTMKALEKKLSEKGYENILSTSKKGMKPDKPADLTELLDEIKKLQ